MATKMSRQKRRNHPSGYVTLSPEEKLRSKNAATAMRRKGGAIDVNGNYISTFMINLRIQLLARKVKIKVGDKSVTARPRIRPAAVYPKVLVLS